MISVLLVDDHELVRTGIEALLNDAEDITVIGVAESGEKAVDAVVTLSPDVVLMDVNMPGIGGVEACRRILQQDPEVKIIAVSVRNDGPIPHQLLKLGVLGFVSKGSPVDEMVNAIRKVMEGKRYLCSEVANNLAFQSLPGGNESPFSALSQREAEVVTLILQGKTIKEMSEMLLLSDKTVNTYRYRLYGKLHVKNDVELIRLAIKFGYIDDALI
ncbi:MAG: response regulator [Methylobacter tundripaludum]|uniref:LuxR family two component transcriptional regulator n=1 Tax=Methylobacter tundripaludum TaxID=173365 RepID=A0A2S6GQ87_9GAMM|nr:response regulator [Methylobacter tundripaludum]MCF7966404.1 response regulator [Methylobacter tundripaludum]MCK9637811.1 response regulator [Methylobacter tundripaludum]PPK67281.1 LuxR family two component transcriptional regulator [Methylobacter tundripaludum]